MYTFRHTAVHTISDSVFLCAVIKFVASFSQTSHLLSFLEYIVCSQRMLSDLNYKFSPISAKPRLSWNTFAAHGAAVVLVQWVESLPGVFLVQDSFNTLYMW